MANDTYTKVLSQRKVGQKLDRIAREIYEHNFRQEEVVLVGIADRGSVIARRLKAILEEISPLTVHLASLRLDKNDPLNAPITLDADVELGGRSVVLVDDVLNAGRTLIYAARELLAYPVQKLKTVVLVDRQHRNFPIKVDFVGLTLATTLKEHIRVELDNEWEGVYLI